MDRQHPAVFAAAIISLATAAFALVMAFTTSDNGNGASTPAVSAPAVSASTATAGTSVPAVSASASAVSPPAAGAGASGASDASKATLDITIQDFTFTPADATVAAGTTVVFTNHDSFAHSIVSDDGAFPSSPHLDEGDTYEVVLTEPGTYAYSCGIHPQMHGTITVEG